MIYSNFMYILTGIITKFQTIYFLLLIIITVWSSFESLLSLRSQKDPQAIAYSHECKTQNLSFLWLFSHYSNLPRIELLSVNTRPTFTKPFVEHFSTATESKQKYRSEKNMIYFSSVKIQCLSRNLPQWFQNLFNVFLSTADWRAVEVYIFSGSCISQFAGTCCRRYLLTPTVRDFYFTLIE